MCYYYKVIYDGRILRHKKDKGMAELANVCGTLLDFQKGVAIYHIN